MLHVMVVVLITTINRCRVSKWRLEGTHTIVSEGSARAESCRTGHSCGTSEHRGELPLFPGNFGRFLNFLSLWGRSLWSYRWLWLLDWLGDDGLLFLVKLAQVKLWRFLLLDA